MDKASQRRRKPILTRRQLRARLKRYEAEVMEHRKRLAQIAAETLALVNEGNPHWREAARFLEVYFPEGWGPPGSPVRLRKVAHVK